MKQILPLLLTILFLGACSSPDGDNSGKEAPRRRSITDGTGRTVELPDTVRHIICSGAGALRYATYLQASDMVVAVDNAEKKAGITDTKPYSLAHTEYRDKPLFGEYRGNDDPEKILTLDPLPDVIIKTYPAMGTSPGELQEKTGIPVIALEYGDLVNDQKNMFYALRCMGDVLDRRDRAEDVICFFKKNMEILAHMELPRTEASYVGGIAFKGTHGFASTAPAYTPFRLLGIENAAAPKNAPGNNLKSTIISKENIIKEDPKYIFLDLSSTINPAGEGNALWELANDPVYAGLQAKKDNRVYTLLPYNSYTTNHGSVLANAFYIATVLGAEGYENLDPAAKANSIYRFLVGENVFNELDTLFSGKVFERLAL
ncbi:MAG: ABC transporter substrate-binding protein [Fibrobacterota bacterium]